MKPIYILTGIFGMCLMVVPLIAILIIGEDKHIEVTKYYDRFSNEIIGVVCEEEVYSNENAGVLIDFIPTFFLVGFGLIFISIIMYEIEDLE